MRKYGLWAGLGVVLLVAAVVIGVVAVRRPGTVAERGEEPPVGTDAMIFALGDVGREFGGFKAPITDKPAKITKDAAIQKASGEGVPNDAESVTAYHVLLTSTNGPAPSHGATNSPVSNFREQGQSVWMVVFKGVTRPPSPSAGPVPDGTSTAPARSEAPSKANIVVLIDADTGASILQMIMPMSLPKR